MNTRAKVIAAVLVAAAAVVITIAVTAKPRQHPVAQQPSEPPPVPGSGSASAQPTLPVPQTGSPLPGDSPAAHRTYRVASDLCAATDFAPVTAIAGQPADSAVGDHEDKATFTAFTCDRRFSGGTVYVTARIFQNGQSADADFAAIPSPSTAQLWFHDGNLVFGVRIKTSDGKAPAAGWHDAAADLAGKTMAKLRS